MKDSGLLWTVRRTRRPIVDRRARLAAAVAALMVCLASVAAPNGMASDNRSEPLTMAPAAPSPQCGDTIIRSVRLRTDLICPGDGLIVGADNVVIDLNGHTIRGDSQSGEDGVRSLNHRNVTIRNGTIRNFAVGVRLSGSQAANLVNLRVLAQRGGELGGTMEIGLELSNTTGVTVRGCTISINNLATEILASGDNLLISETSVSGSNPSPLSSGTVSLSGDVTIERSRLVDVAVDWRGRLVVEDSELIESSIELGDTSTGDNTFTAKLTGNTFSGSPCFCFTGEYTISIVTILGDSNMEITGVEIHGNTFDGATAAGVFIQTTASSVTDVTISGNTFSNNGYGNFVNLPLRDINGSLVNDGLHITVAPGTDITVADNQTNHNADYGIEAEPGTVIDGGGNVSSNDPSGCLGVICA